jgi:hypothetical protein
MALKFAPIKMASQQEATTYLAHPEIGILLELVRTSPPPRKSKYLSPLPALASKYRAVFDPAVARISADLSERIYAAYRRLLQIASIYSNA